MLIIQAQTISPANIHRCKNPTAAFIQQCKAAGVVGCRDLVGHAPPSQPSQRQWWHAMVTCNKDRILQRGNPQHPRGSRTKPRNTGPSPCTAPASQQPCTRWHPIDTKTPCQHTEKNRLTCWHKWHQVLPYQPDTNPEQCPCTRLPHCTGQATPCLHSRQCAHTGAHSSWPHSRP